MTICPVRAHSLFPVSASQRPKTHPFGHSPSLTHFRETKQPPPVHRPPPRPLCRRRQRQPACWRVVAAEASSTEMERPDGRTPDQLRPLACSRSILNRAHGSASWSQGDTKVLAAVYGPKAGTKKNENPEKASIEVIWKQERGQIGKMEREYEMILKRTLESICIRTIYPNTTTSVIVQVVHDDGALLPCAINAACAALVDAGVPLKHLAVAICCSVADSCYIILDPTKHEEEKMKAFAYLVFPNTIVSVLTERSLHNGGEPMAHGIITSVTHGAMSVDDYLHCLERGRATTARLSEFLRKNIEPKATSESSKAG